MENIKCVNEAIRQFYKQTNVMVSSDLIDAVLYSVDGGGKRIRPLLFLELVQGFGQSLEESHFAVAAAVEMIHTGSLIHDDLPAMDNDDYRRGRLTNHKKFDEATAILAGDSLFLDASYLIAQADFPAEQVVQLIKQLSLAAGTFGMVGGQMLDMKSEEKELSVAELSQIHAAKTGALLAFPFVAAGIVTNQPADVQDLLAQAGHLIGHAFQVRDDILDVTASFEELGKTPNKDVVAQKMTYPRLLGLEKSRQILTENLDQAANIFESLHQIMVFQPEAILDIIERLRLHD